MGSLVAKAKRKVGRPIQFVCNKKSLAEIQKLGAVYSVEDICDFYGVSTSTFYRAVKRQPEIMVHYKKGKAIAKASVALPLLTRARNGDNVASIFYLKTQCGWRETQAIDHTSGDGSMSPAKELKIKYVKVTPEKVK